MRNGVKFSRQLYVIKQRVTRTLPRRILSGGPVRSIRWPQRRLRSVSRGRIVVSVCLLSLAAAACNVLSNEDQRREPDVFDKIRSVDLLPRFPAPTGTATTGRGQVAGPQTYLGDGTPQARDISSIVGAQAAPGGE